MAGNAGGDGGDDGGDAGGDEGGDEGGITGGEIGGGSPHSPSVAQSSSNHVESQRSVPSHGVDGPSG